MTFEAVVCEPDSYRFLLVDKTIKAFSKLEGFFFFLILIFFKNLDSNSPHTPLKVALSLDSSNKVIRL